MTIKTTRKLQKENEKGAAPQHPKIWCFWSDHEAVSQATDGLDILGLGGFVLNFLTQPVDVDHDGGLVNDGFAPDHFVEHFLGENTVDVV